MAHGGGQPTSQSGSATDRIGVHVPSDTLGDSLDHESQEGAVSTSMEVCGENRTDTSNVDNANMEEPTFNSPLSVTGQKIDWSIFKSEAERLKTFCNWTIPFIDKEKLAAAGFVYSRDSDVVTCVFCGTEIGHWVKGDDPFKEHQKWCPSCPFVTGFDVGNVPIDESKVPVQPKKKLAYDTCGLFGINIPASGMRMGCTPLEGLSAALEKLGITYSTKPLWAEYITLDSRLKTYENWPISMYQRPEVLSEAGFFYTGKGDQTVCFHCGKGLRYWEKQDDPWVQHALWFPRCAYVVMTKGKAFVDRIQENKAKLTSAKGGDNSEMKNLDTSANSIQIEENAATGCSDNETDVHLCKICAERERALVFLPCGHVIACVECGPTLSLCPECNVEISARMRVHIA